MFFDEYPDFFETSETSPRPWRLNLRHEAIFAEHSDLFAGKSVLDIASHDGRWTLAALAAGATHVIGIEARGELVEISRRNLNKYEFDPGRWDFVQGDVFEEMAQQEFRVDTVLCLGFFYHTLRHSELWMRMRECHPAAIVIDTLIEPRNDGAFIRVATEHVARQGNAVQDPLTHGDRVLVGKPSKRALRRMARAYGYDLAGYSDWERLLRNHPDADGVGDYRDGRRITAVYRVAN